MKEFVIDFQMKAERDEGEDKENGGEEWIRVNGLHLTSLPFGRPVCTRCFVLGVMIDGCELPFYHPYPSCHQAASINLNGALNHYVKAATRPLQPLLPLLPPLVFSLCHSHMPLSPGEFPRYVKREGVWWMATCFLDELGTCRHHLHLPIILRPEQLADLSGLILSERVHFKCPLSVGKKRNRQAICK